MTHEEFTPEVLRLYRGFRVEDDLTPEKLQALFDAVGHHPVAVVRDAVTAALREPKLPWFDRFHVMVEQAAENDRSLERQHHHQQAVEFLNTTPRAVSNEWAREHLRAIHLLIDGKRDEARAVLAAVSSSAQVSPDA